MYIVKALKLPEQDIADWVQRIGSVPPRLWYAGIGFLVGSVVVATGIWLVGRYFLGNRPSQWTQWVWWRFAIGVFLAVAIAAIILPVAFWDWLGPIFATSVFLIILTIAGGRLVAASRATGVPIVTTLVLYSLLLSGLGLNDNTRLATAPESNGDGSVEHTPAPRIAEQFKAWVESRSDLPKFVERGVPYPIYVVAAQGGGMYAAYHTAMVLSNLQDLCPAFASHLFAISAVSGGSLGSATFHAVLTPERARIQACSDTDRWLMTNDAGKILQADFLSPLIGYLLFPDFLQRVLPMAFPTLDRARALERVFIEQVGKFAGRMSNPSEVPYLQHWTPEGTGPALIFNATEVRTGQRRIIAPFKFPSKDVNFLPLWRRTGDLTLSVASAAIVSARFPWLTPSAWFDVRPGEDGAGRASARIRLVDGGYFENSGVSTAHDLVRAIDYQVGELGLSGKVEVYLFVLTSPDVAQTPPTTEILSELFDPVQALLNTRDARARAALARAEEELGFYSAPAGERRPRVRKFPIEGLGLGLPLGWRLSGTTRIVIDIQIGERGRCSATEAGHEDAVSFEADCVVHQVYDELNRGLK
jgi:hypothetical protein